MEKVMSYEEAADLLKVEFGLYDNYNDFVKALQIRLKEQFDKVTFSRYGIIVESLQ